MMERLKLTVNETKTRLCRAPEDPFDFLGYTLGWCYDRRTGRRFIGTRPSKKRMGRMCEAIHVAPSGGQPFRPLRPRWTNSTGCSSVGANYFCLGQASAAYRIVDAHTGKRLRQWLCRKHRQAGLGRGRYPDRYLYGTLGLVRLTARRKHNRPWAKHDLLSESRMREIRTSGSMSGTLETEHGEASEAPADESTGQRLGTA